MPIRRLCMKTMMPHDGEVTELLTRPCLPTPAAVNDPRRGVGAVTIENGRVCCTIDGVRISLHALWLRDRSTSAGAIDPSNRQRLYEPTDLDDDLRVVEASGSNGDLVVQFSDGHRCMVSSQMIAVASDVRPDPEAPPRPRTWRTSDIETRFIAWEHLGNADEMTRAMRAFFEHGFFVLRGTPTIPGSILDIAERFGRVSSTNFGVLFDVQSKPNPDDLAYTPVALAAHVDQPYRAPSPGLQFLHALVNDAPGGDSTVVDGLTAIEELRRHDSGAFRALCELDIEFRYDIGTDVKVATGPVIDLFADGRLRILRYSSRLDFPPAVDPDVLDAWFRGRRLLSAYLNDSANQLQFRLDAGDVLVVDNHRVLHGRTAFDPSRGHRHVQGCYIDHDGPQTVWRLLARGTWEADRRAE